MPQFGDYDPLGSLTGNELLVVATPAGTRQVKMSQVASFGYRREFLTASRIYYVRPDGNDNNDGRTNDAAGAFRTIQRAVDEVVNKLDIAGLAAPVFMYDPADMSEYVRIQVADGTYTENLKLQKVTGQRHNLQVQIVGNVANPAAVVLQAPEPIRRAAVFATGGQWFIEGLKVDMATPFPTTGGHAFTSDGMYSAADLPPTILVGNVHVVAPSVGDSIAFFARHGGRIRTLSNSDNPRSVRIEGCFAHYAYAYNNSFMDLQINTLVLFNNPVITQSFLYLTEQSLVWFWYDDIDGACTGKRFEATIDSSIQTWGSGLNFIPGTIAGTADAGSTYDGLPLAETIPLAAIAGLTEALAIAGYKELLSESRTYYVRPDGSDSNSGLTNTSGGAWKTIQHAIDWVTTHIELPGTFQDTTIASGVGAQINLTIQVADGVYSEEVILRKIEGGSYYLTGNPGAPDNVVIKGVGGYYTVAATNGTIAQIDGFTLSDENYTHNTELLFVMGATVFFQNLAFDIHRASTCVAAYANAQVYSGWSPLTLSGPATNIGSVFSADQSSTMELAFPDIVVNGNFSFNPSNNWQAFLSASRFSYIGFYWERSPALAGTGSIAGRRFHAETGGQIQTYGGGASYVPGSAVGDLMDASSFYDGLTGNGKIPISTIIGLDAALAEANQKRELLTTDRTYYVRPDGNDNNDGRTSTTEGAFRTIQRAVDEICQKLDLSAAGARIGKAALEVTIQLAAGTYNEAVRCEPLNSNAWSLWVTIQGNAADGSDTVVHSPGMSAFVVNGGNWNLQNLTVISPNDAVICALNGANLSLKGTVRFVGESASSSGAYTAIYAGDASGVGLYGNMVVDSSFTGAAAFITIDTASVGWLFPSSFTFIGTPSLGSFANISAFGQLQASHVSATGSFAGKKFDVTNQGQIITWGAGLSMLPGSLVGTLDDSSSYDDMSGLQYNGKLRELLMTPRTYYVRPDGNDGATGLTNTSAGAFKTIQRAINQVARLDVNYQNVVIQVADGTYNESLTLQPLYGAGWDYTIEVEPRVRIRGNTAAPANVHIVGNGYSGTLAALESSALWGVEGVYVEHTTGGPAASAQNGGRIVFWSNCQFKAGGAASTLFLARYGGDIKVWCNDVGIYNTALSTFARLEDNSTFDMSANQIVLLGGGLAVSNAMLDAYNYAKVIWNTSAVVGGAVTGQKFLLSNDAKLIGASIPGSIAGTTVDGATYNGKKLDGFEPRERLFTHRTYYVRPDGNDGNTGLVDADWGALKTIQAAVALVCNTLDLAGFEVDIQVADGTYNETVQLGNVVGAWRSSPEGNFSQVRIVGNTAAPSNVKLVTPVSKVGIVADTVTTRWGVGGMEIDTTAGSAYCIQLFRGNLDLIGPMRFKGQQYAAQVTSASSLYVNDNVTVVGDNMSGLIRATGMSHVEMYAPQLIFTAPVTFGVSTVVAEDGSMVYWSVGSITGSAIGKRYTVRYGAGIQTYGAGASAIPGSSAGTADGASFGWYN